jgi:hypothetical protein
MSASEKLPSVSIKHQQGKKHKDTLHHLGTPSLVSSSFTAALNAL